jgi:phosphoglycolate phosphatase
MLQNLENNKISVLFDLDGTFVDTSLDLCYVLNTLLKKNNKPLVDESKIKYHISRGAEGLINYGFGNNLSGKDKIKLKKEFLDLYDENTTQHVTLIKGIANLIDQIESKKILWGIVTNKHSKFAIKVMEELNYHDRASCLVTGDMVDNAKPAPDSLILACYKLNIEPENSIYVGDDRRDIIAGQRAKMKTAIADFGFINTNDNINDWNADIILSKPGELIKYII